MGELEEKLRRARKRIRELCAERRQLLKEIEVNRWCDRADGVNEARVVLGVTERGPLDDALYDLEMRFWRKADEEHRK